MSDTATRSSFETAWSEWRRERDRVLAEPYGILSITSINFLSDEPISVTGIPGRWSTSSAGPVVELADGEELENDGGPTTGRIEFGPLTDGAPRQLRSGAIAIEVFRKDGWDIVRPRDPAAPARARFAGTPAYDPAQRWIVTGRWVPYPSPHSVHIGSVQARLGGPVDAPGEVRFELEGRPQRLIAVPAHGAEGRVALLFRDGTSGVTTYPAQRELILTLPESGDQVQIDFNRAYNKNCAYTDFAVCPLPPAGNTLDVAIEAGERIPDRLVG